MYISTLCVLYFQATALLYARTCLSDKTFALYLVQPLVYQITFCYLFNAIMNCCQIANNVERSKGKALVMVQKSAKGTLLFQSHTLLSSFPDRLLNTAGLPVMIHNCCVLSGEFCTSPEELTIMSYNFQCYLVTAQII